MFGLLPPWLADPPRMHSPAVACCSSLLQALRGKADQHMGLFACFCASAMPAHTPCSGTHPTCHKLRLHVGTHAQTLNTRPQAEELERKQLYSTVIMYLLSPERCLGQAAASVSTLSPPPVPSSPTDAPSVEPTPKFIKICLMQGLSSSMPISAATQ